MAKLALFPPLLVLACIVAGLYGMLHNQISYTVSPEYFHAFKFHQFRIPEHLHNRWGAALVGWHASWWMGLIVGVRVLLVGLILPGSRTYFTRALVAMVVVSATTLLVGLGALVSVSLRDADLDVWWLEHHHGVADRAAFYRAGTMHNFSYLGGGLGILTGSLYLVLARVRCAPPSSQKNPASPQSAC